MKKTIVVALIVGVLGGIGGKLALRGTAGPTATPAITAAPNEVVAANGTVEGLRPEVSVRPEVAGIVTAIHARENDTVRPGQVVVELSNETQKRRSPWPAPSWPPPRPSSTSCWPVSGTGWLLRPGMT